MASAKPDFALPPQTVLHAHYLLGDTLDRFEQMYEQAGAVTGTPTGFTDLDTKLYGLQPGALIVLAYGIAYAVGTWRAWPALSPRGAL